MTTFFSAHVFADNFFVTFSADDLTVDGKYFSGYFSPVDIFSIDVFANNSFVTLLRRQLDG